MKKIFLVIFILSPFISWGQIITTWAGSGIGGDGTPAISAMIYDPNGSFFNKQGNFYFVEVLGNRIRKVDTTGIITSIAGTGNHGYNGDGGLADTSEIYQPSAVITDSLGNVFFGDAGNSRVRKIDHISGIISTIAGTGIAGYGGENIPAINSELFYTGDLWFDKNDNLLIAEATRLRKVNPLGIITTVAGYNNPGYISTVNGGLADTTAIGVIGGVTTDTAGSIYISDYYNHKVYKINNQGFITTIAGTGNSYMYNGDNIPSINATIDPGFLRVDIHTGNLFINDNANNRIRMIDGTGIIHTVAGNGTMNYTGDGGFADIAGIPDPGGLSFDNCGNLYIAQVGNPARIRKVTFDTACHIHAAQTTPIDTVKTAVNNVIATNNINVYPNPATDVLHIEAQESISYRLMNIVGAVVQQGALQAGSNTVDVAGLVSGVYVLEISNENGRVVRKILKQ